MGVFLYVLISNNLYISHYKRSLKFPFICNYYKEKYVELPVL